MAALFVILIRLIIPISIFRWPLVGSILSMLADGADVILVDVFSKFLGEPSGFGSDYHFLDKWLDLYYFSFQFYVSLGWKDVLAKRTSITLFIFRLAGSIIFELTHIRKILFFFPNLFENFFLYYLVVKKYFPRLIPKTFPSLALILFLLYIPKFFQELILHYLQLQPWNWFKETFLS